jgi:hypothetical protein
MERWHRVRIPLLVFLLAWYAPVSPEWLGLAGDPAPASAPLTGVTIVRPPTTVWDIIQLTLVPIVLSVGGLWFNREENNRAHALQKQREEEAQKLQRQQEAEAERAAAERLQDNTLQSYLDRMTDLLLHQGLDPTMDSQEYPVLVARVHTLTALNILGGARKAAVLQFLYEADLVGCPILDQRGEVREVAKPVVNLKGARLEGIVLPGVRLEGASLNVVHLEAANLREAHLSHASLETARLTGAHLDGAWLIECNLVGAYLQNAQLVGATRIKARLFGAHMEDANLSEARAQGADLESANLSRAWLDNIDLTDARLGGANLSNAHLLQARLAGPTCSGRI